MDQPKITYHLLNADDTYTKQSSVYAGTYTGNEAIEINLQIWNNYRGTEDIEDLENFSIVARFLTEEDNALLRYISLSITDEIEIPSIIENNALIKLLKFYGKKIENNALIGTFIDPVTLSGQANTGSEEYTQNYIPITVTFNPAPGAYLKDHDLKSLVIEIVEL